ncbi:hypothetical protein IFO70_36140 [Phormidium tenue FACHB-886]|nr:hypothetical protein [Phormidium tenue FACHB-886]
MQSFNFDRQAISNSERVSEQWNQAFAPEDSHAEFEFLREQVASFQQYLCEQLRQQQVIENELNKANQELMRMDMENQQLIRENQQLIRENQQLIREIQQLVAENQQVLNARRLLDPHNETVSNFLHRQAEGKEIR